MSRKDKVNMIGLQFGKWTVLEESFKKGKRTFWKCKCECGTIKDLEGSMLRLGQSTKCKECTKAEMIGLTFGNWEVLEYSHTASDKKLYYKCKCKCGRIELVQGTNLRLGKSTQCLHCSNRQSKGEYNSKYTAEEASIQRIKHNYKTRCTKKNREFSLSDEKFKELIFSNCHYCGISPSTTVNALKGTDRSKEKEAKGWITYNGIDRIDNSKGYTEENSVTCCEICNDAKNDRSEAEFDAWLKRAYEHRFGTK